jgi:hypothetical protein
MSQIVVDTDVASYIFNWHSLRTPDVAPQFPAGGENGLSHSQVGQAVPPARPR